MNNPYDSPALESVSQDESVAHKQSFWSNFQNLEPGHYFLALILYYAVSFGISYAVLVTISSQGISEASLVLCSIVISIISAINICVTGSLLIKLRRSRWLIGVFPCLLIEIALLLFYSLELQPDSEALYYWVIDIWLRGTILFCLLGILIVPILMFTDIWRKDKRGWLHFLGVSCLFFYYIIVLSAHVYSNQNM